MRVCFLGFIMPKLLNFPMIMKYALGGALLLVMLVLLLSPIGILVFLLVLLLAFIMGRNASNNDTMARSLAFVQKHAVVVLVFQSLVYALAYVSLLPAGMYFAPDSLSYLLVSEQAPPNFSLIARGLVELELAFDGTQIVLLRYLAIMIYTVGGGLLAKALLQSGRPLLALLVLPALWSMSSLTQWFNYFLTDGLATSLLVACIGAYANMYVSICGGSAARRTWGWLGLFILLGMLAFSMRPAFAFIAPVMVFLMFNRHIFQWRRVIAASLGVAVLASAHFSFAIYWHGRMPTQMGGVLTALVFDFPIPHTCGQEDDSNICRSQRVLEPFIKASRDLGATREQYVYKLLNNSSVTMSARASIKGGDPHYEALLDIALLKIKSNPWDYVWMVIRHSYYSVKSWGDWAWNDHFGGGNVAMVNIENNNAIAPAVSDAMLKVFGVNFDPTIDAPAREVFYKNILFQFPRVVVNHHVVYRLASVLSGMAIVFMLLPVFVSSSLVRTILSACCAMSVGGMIFQNMFFPAAPRLLDPFHPLAAVGVLMLVSLIMDARRATKLRFPFFLK